MGYSPVVESLIAPATEGCINHHPHPSKPHRSPHRHQGCRRRRPFALISEHAVLPPLLVLNWPRQEVSQGDDSDGDDDDGDGDDGS